MLHKSTFAKLISGPLDGETVEFGGRYHIRSFAEKRTSRPPEWRRAVYRWQRADDNVGIEGIFIGFDIDLPFILPTD